MASASPLQRLHVVLVAPRNPLNIGAVARAMSNFGVSHLRLVNPYAVAFREARSAKGAAGLLARAQEFPTLAEAVHDCALVVGTTDAHKRELQHPLKPLPQAAPVILRRLRAAPVALLFGSEKYGLSVRDLSHCHWLLRIPTRAAHGSMNLGQAAAVCLYELARRTPPATPPAKDKKAAAAQLERLTGLLLDCLHASGYIAPPAAVSAEDKMRRLVRRLQLSDADADLWLGIFRQIVWKLRHPRQP